MIGATESHSFCSRRACRLAILLVLPLGAASASTIYSYTDAQGNTVFTDEPRDGAERIEVDPPPPIPLRQLDLPPPITPPSSASPTSLPDAPEPSRQPALPAETQSQTTAPSPQVPSTPEQAPAEQAAEAPVERVEHEHGGWTETTTRPPSGAPVPPTEPQVPAQPGSAEPPQAPAQPDNAAQPLLDSPAPAGQPQVERVEHEHGGWTEVTTRPPGGQEQPAASVDDAQPSDNGVEPGAATTADSTATEPSAAQTADTESSNNEAGFMIAQPADSVATLGPGDTLLVELALTPPLDTASGDRIDIYVDDQRRIQASSGLRHLISGVEPGERQIHARVMRDGTERKRTDTQTVQVVQP